MSSSTDPKVIVALDFAELDAALALVEQLSPDECRLKVGKEMFTRFGPEWVKRLVGMGFEIFLDLKFHDIPNTTAKACAAAADLGVWMLNVHASGGDKMMDAARAALEPMGNDKPHLIAVTVLTSMDQGQLDKLIPGVTIEQQVQRLAQLTQRSGLNGVVCSAHEAAPLRQQLGSEFLLVTPGIRPVGADTQDQKRIMTPPQALAAGVSYMVIGRPITQADDPAQALQAINRSLR